MTCASWYAGARVGPPETRREPVHGGSEPTSLLATVSGGPTHTPARFCGALIPMDPVGPVGGTSSLVAIVKQKIPG